MRRWMAAAGALAGVAVIGVVGLRLAPPELLRLGTAYAAKIVCSNVHLAGRDADEVMAVDVQAPGHPLLKLVAASVDGDSATVAFPFGIARTHAVATPGRGCTVSDADTAGPGTQLPPVEPSALPEAIDPRVADVLARKDLLGQGWRAALVLHRGRVVGERYAPGFDADTPLLSWSVAKTVTAALIGTAVERGLVSLDDDRLFEAWTDGRAAITVRDMLAMQPGLAWNEDYGGVSDVSRMLFLDRDVSRLPAAAPLESEPGTAWTYSTGTTVLLGDVLERAVGGGEAAIRYPYEALFAPLGMAGTVLEIDQAGGLMNGSFLYAPARDYARFARVLLEEGRAPNGARLVPEGYARWMMEPTEASGGVYANGQMWRRGWGERTNADWGLPEETVWMRGHDGQFVALVPELDLAVVRLGLTPKSLDYAPQPLVAAVIDALGAQALASAD